MNFLPQQLQGTDAFEQVIPLPGVSFHTGDPVLDAAFRLALGDITGNIVPFQDGLLTQPAMTLLAGLNYDTPWTRDAAINTWNGAGLLFPQVTRNTLLSVLKRDADSIAIGGQYWDAIIWVNGAWWQYLYTGDQEFLALAFEAVKHSLALLEESEFSPDLNLFRGPACYGDGVAAYPDIYAHTHGSSSILDWVKVNPDLRAQPGFGLPMHALSTNCLYYGAYLLLERMAESLQQEIEPSWAQKALALKEAINTHFWDAETSKYRYLVDKFGNNEYQEGLGHAFLLLFNLANEEQTASILEGQYVTAHGIPCLWPSFARYSTEDGTGFGRHAGTVWPHIQAFWAQVVAEHGYLDHFEFELRALAEKACRDSQFAEIYHPLTGEIYGGLQEGRDGGFLDTTPGPWRSCVRQTWSATGYIRMITLGMLGMDFTTDGIHFSPRVPRSLQHVRLRNLAYRQMHLDIEVLGNGNTIQQCLINGHFVASPSIPVTATGYQQVIIHLV